MRTTIRGGFSRNGASLMKLALTLFIIGIVASVAAIILTENALVAVVVIVSWLMAAAIPATVAYLKEEHKKRVSFRTKLLASLVALVAVAGSSYYFVTEAIAHAPVLAEQNAPYQARENLKQQAVDSLKALNFSDVRGVVLSEDGKRGEALVQLDGHSKPVGISVELRDDQWVPGCPTTDGGMIPLADNDNEYGKILQLSGGCPPALVKK